MLVGRLAGDLAVRLQDIVRKHGVREGMTVEWSQSISGAFSIVTDQGRHESQLTPKEVKRAT